jgi:hypothetical protein
MSDGYPDRDLREATDKATPGQKKGFTPVHFQAALPAPGSYTTCESIDWGLKRRNLDQDNACAPVLLPYWGFFLEQLLKQEPLQRDGMVVNEKEKKRSMMLYSADQQL